MPNSELVHRCRNLACFIPSPQPPQGPFALNTPSPSPSPHSQNSRQGKNTLHGVIHRVVHHDDQSGFAILKVTPQDGRRGEPITVTGNVPRVVAGETLKATGEWVQHPNYGRQFKASAIQLGPPETTEGLERYLGSGLIEGIGPKYAKRIVDKFGSDTLHIIEHESARLEEIDGIGRKRRQEIRASWLQQKHLHDIMIFLHQRGISTSRAQRIHRAYGETAMEVLQTNPYRLAEDISGIGFKTADDIAAHMGIEKQAPQRIRAGLFEVLQSAANSGHNALPREQLAIDAGKILDIPQPLIEALIAELIRERTFILQEMDGRDLVFLPPALQAEVSISRSLMTLMNGPSAYPEFDIPAALDWCEKRLQIQLAESQKDAIREALSQRVLIITGGPGVGKTTIINSILTILTAKNIKPVLAAPTGRAAQRLAASTNREAFTMHRLLEYQGEGVWGRNHARPLKGDLFVLDEASMIDTALMAQFLGAIPAGAHLLIVGDADQLPSVGPGAVLHDLIASKLIPTVKLTEIFRQAAQSQIIHAAHAINLGHLPSLKPSPDSDFFFLERQKPEDIQHTILDLCQRRLPAKYQFDPLRDIQVLTPMNIHELGARRFNQLLQQKLNPPHELKFEIERNQQTYRVGDKVIQIHNNYDKEVFNGDIGHIVRIDLDPVRVHVRFEAGREVGYEPAELEQLQLAYAITIHKSQGSEFPCVIIPCSMSQFIMLERSLLYTAITRGRKLVVMVGESKALQLAARQTNAHKRWTGLQQQLRCVLSHRTP